MTATNSDHTISPVLVKFANSAAATTRLDETPERYKAHDNSPRLMQPELLVLIALNVSTREPAWPGQLRRRFSLV